MSRQIQIRRGTAAENDAFTGAIGEVTMDTTNNTLRVHDGTTAGGTKMAKQSEVSSGLNDKLNKTLDNITNEAKITSVSWGRQFTVVDAVIAQGNSDIATFYDLSQHLNGDTTRTKMGLFSIKLVTTQSGFSNASLKSDLMTNYALVCGINNGMACMGSIWLPFTQAIRLSFPSASAGIGSNTTLTFVGYM